MAHRYHHESFAPKVVISLLLIEAVVQVIGLAAPFKVSAWAAEVPSKQNPNTSLTSPALLAQAGPADSSLPRQPIPDSQPRPVLPNPDELLPPSPRPTLTLPLNPAPLPNLPPETGGAGEETLVVNRFKVIGSTVFSEAELQAVLTPFTGRPLTLSELLQARTAVTQLYLDAGYVTSGAYIPPQEPESGTVTIQVIEGRITDIQVQGNRRLNTGYITSRLGLGSQPPLRVESLVEALRLLQLNPLIKNISAELAAGIEPGTNTLIVTVEEADSFSVDFVSNNDRSPAVGSWERGLVLNEGNLLGLGDGLQAGYLNTDGSDRISVNYTLPINARNGTLGTHLEYTQSKIVAAPANILDINSDSYVADFTYRQPILLTPTQELALSLTGSWSKSRTVFLGNLIGTALPFPSLGANENGEIEVFALRFGQDWTSRGSSEVLALRSQFTLGLGGSTPVFGGADAPDSNFFAWLGQAQWAKLLGPDTLLLLRGDAQLASDSLPAQELFGLGGRQTVRGYRQNRLLTDNALLASAEVRLPLLRNREHQSLLQIIPFLDIGTGWNTRLPNPDISTLAGTGVGFQWSEGNAFQARLDWGIPLLSTGPKGNTWQEQGIYFSIGLNAF